MKPKTNNSATEDTEKDTYGFVALVFSVPSVSSVAA